MKAGLIAALLLGLTSPAPAFAQSETPDAMAFWSEHRRGANFFNEVETEQRIADAARAGLDFIRLTPSKWRDEAGQGLFGDLSTPYEGVNPALIAHLVAMLDAAEAHDIKVVLTLLDMPCMYGRQGDDPDTAAALWRNEACLDQAAKAWTDLASALDAHPALAGYNPLNEPQPAPVLADIDAPGDDFLAFTAAHQGTTADLDLFNARMISAIRSVDATTPIHLEPDLYAAPAALPAMAPVEDARVIYSVHLYPSWLYGTHRANRGRFTYPDAMPMNWNGDTERWEDGRLCALMNPALEWIETHRIPREQLVVAEFGVSRRVAGAEAYLSDILSCLEDHDLHWAFYSYREDAWDEMDYELASDAPAWAPSHTDEAGYRIKNWQTTTLYQLLDQHLTPEP
ncbi:glycoside hydrolase family 5 protein [Oceanicaulis sp. LC35]|uniref:glycoside hydrolase family 5 protein n=1 Tax=Oceanicaulis sp. LC35 TaxID=3349635 RepID=UPI003F829E40